MCRSGHVVSWFVDAVDLPFSHCPKCGEPVLVACAECGKALPADAEMLSWVPYHSHCAHCGRPYPWQADAIARAKRALAERAEVDGWSEAVARRAEELIDELDADRATESGVVAATAWLAARGAENATPIIIDAVKRIASIELKQALRAHFPELV